MAACLVLASFGLLSVAGPFSAAIAPATPSAPPDLASVTSTATAAPTLAPTLEPTTEATPSPTATSSPTPTPTPRVLSEVRVNGGTEPTVSASPFDPKLVAVISQNISWSKNCSIPAVAISRDAGATWKATKSPWGSVCQDMHAILAWGPGPAAGSSRLWAANATGVKGGVALSISHSDNEGVSWSPRYIEKFTPPWVGCYPAIAVDNSPSSPNFGAVYLAYNWLPNSKGIGISVIATRDGSSWVHTEVPAIGQPGYPYTWRFGNRLAVAPGGAAYVSFWENDMRYWDSNDMFNQGWSGNIGRTGYATARIHLGTTLTADPPVWAIDQVPAPSAAFDPGSQSSLAVSDSGELWMAVNDTTATGGTIRIGCSTDDGANWSWRTLDVPGKQSFKASIAMADGVVFVGWHAVGEDGLVGTYYTLSYDGGATFLPPHPVTQATYHEPVITNGTGLRENADFENGRIYYAWGDARDGLSTYVATIQP
jgi:hypothetical protein